MNRRTFVMGGLGLALEGPLLGAMKQDKFDAAAAALAKAAEEGTLHAASLCVRHGKDEVARSFGAAKTPDAMLLLASITKTLSAAAILTLVDREKLRLEDPVSK